MGKIVWPGVAMIAVTYALARFSFGLLVSGPIALLFTEYWRLAYLLFVMIALAVFL